MNSTDARALFTKTLIDVYQERIRPTGFLRSFFPIVTSPSKNLSIEVERMGEKIAVDVLRGTEGNRNTFSKSTEKMFEPPLYREFFDATQLDLYDRVLGSQGNNNAPLFAALMNTVADKLGLLQDKMERSQELQCAQVLFDGIVQTTFGNIDYKRKAASLVNTAGDYFETTTTPFDVFAAGCEFIRTKGRTNDAAFNAIMGQTALKKLLANTQFLGRQDLVSMKLDNVQGPARNGVGANYNGSITAGAYTVHLWTYPQFYQDADNVDQPYVPAKKVAIIPSNPRFKMGFAAVPQLLPDNTQGNVPAQPAYVVGEFRDERKAVHEFDIQCAPLAIPVAVDQIYTFQATA